MTDIDGSARVPNNLHINTKWCNSTKKRGSLDLITIRKFERAIVEHLNLTAPTLDKRDRALKSAGLILSDTEKKGAIPVKPADAAYVILVAVSNARLEDVVKSVEELGRLRVKHFKRPPKGFETLHSALTTIIEQKTRIAVDTVVIRPHTLHAEMSVAISDVGDSNIEIYKFEFGPDEPQTNLMIAKETHIQHEFIIRDLFFGIVTNLLENDSQAARKGDVTPLLRQGNWTYDDALRLLTREHEARKRSENMGE